MKLSAQGQTADYSQFPLPGGSMLSVNGGATGSQMADWLGTIRSFNTGAEAFAGAHAPFGEGYGYNAGTQFAFTGQEGDRNIVNGTVYFPERQYRNSQGRFLSPDPAGMGAVDPSDPQSWNRYAYVGNRPLNTVDPQGTDWGDDWGGWGGGGGSFDISISVGPGGVSFGANSSICAVGVCWDSQQAQKLQAFARAIKDKNWSALLGIEAGVFAQNLWGLGNGGCGDFGPCDGLSGVFGFSDAQLQSSTCGKNPVTGDIELSPHWWGGPKNPSCFLVDQIVMFPGGTCQTGKEVNCYVVNDGNGCKTTTCPSKIRKVDDNCIPKRTTRKTIEPVTTCVYTGVVVPPSKPRK